MNYASYKVTKVWEDGSISAIIILNGSQSLAISCLPIESLR